MDVFQDFDLLIVGGGPGGCRAAERAAKEGLSVGLFEKDRLGGTCLSRGCIPTKSLLKCARVFSEISDSEAFGISCKNVGINQAFVIGRKNNIVSKLEMGIRGGLRKNKVKLFFSEAVLLGKEDGKFLIGSEDKVYSCRDLIIATGSKAVLPGIKGLDNLFENGTALTSDGFLNIPEIPQNLVIIGGGIIGLETASYFAAAGSEVSVVEAAGKICGNLDAECSVVLQKNLEKKGIKFLLSTVVNEAADGLLKCEKDGVYTEIKFDRLFVCTGRKPDIAVKGLEKFNPALTENGGILTDSGLKTSVKNLYCIGDANGRSMLAHTAYREAEVCVGNICGKNNGGVDYDIIPACAYTIPEAGWCGESEESAAKKGLRYEVYKLPMTYSGRFMAENEGLDYTGICKILVEKETDRILGGMIVGSYASEIITVLSNFIALHLTVNDIEKLVFPHPTVCEIIRDTLYSK